MRPWLGVGVGGPWLLSRGLHGRVGCHTSETLPEPLLLFWFLGHPPTCNGLALGRHSPQAWRLWPFVPMLRQALSPVGGQPCTDPRGLEAEPAAPGLTCGGSGACAEGLPLWAPCPANSTHRHAVWPQAHTPPRQRPLSQRSAVYNPSPPSREGALNLGAPARGGIRGAAGRGPPPAGTGPPFRWLQTPAAEGKAPKGTWGPDLAHTGPLALSVPCSSGWHRGAARLPGGGCAGKGSG